LVKNRFVLRLDGAKDNDEFFDRRRQLGAAVAYSGTSMSVGSAWIPDLIEVDEDASELQITLVELEASEPAARVSCRKYLPESSTSVLESLAGYVAAVVKQCRGTADPRLTDFEWLAAQLNGDRPKSIRTAGALRSAAGFLELHSLLDQPQRLTSASTPTDSPLASVQFEGVRSFTREEVDGLRRTVRVFHAVVTGDDHSATTVHSWHNRRRKPLEAAVGKLGASRNELRSLLSHKSMSGRRVNCDHLATELAELWGAHGDRLVSSQHVAASVRLFMPAAMSFSGKDSMRDVFDKARSVLTSFGAI
jgi:hypothetical protein